MRRPFDVPATGSRYRRRRERYRGASALGAVALLALTISPIAEAAPTTWADPTGSCAGNTPCFLTVADAIANAGPAPAQVFVFPGTYAESVDLTTMGSAIGEVAGELELVSVDASGSPSPGAAIDPSAPGGPGSGSAVYASGYSAPLTIDGLVVRSPDDNGISLLAGTADVTLMEIDASTCPSGNGAAVINHAGDVRIEQSRAALNLNSGFALTTETGKVEVDTSVAERNDGEGFALNADNISVVDSRAQANGARGFLAIPIGTGGNVSVHNVEASANQGIGLVAAPVDLATAFANVSVNGLVVTGNQGSGVTVLFTTSTIEATAVQASSNAGAGGSFGTATGSVALMQSQASDNGEQGFSTIGVLLEIADVLVERNGDLGLLAAAEDSYSLANATARDNASYGVFAGPLMPSTETAKQGMLDNLTAERNLDVGIVALADEVVGSTLTAADNGSFGIVAAGEQSVELSGLTVSGHSRAGIGVLGTGSLVLSNSVADSNTIGYLITAGEAVIDSAMARHSGPIASDPFDGSGFVFASTNEAVVNSSEAILNDGFGWVFTELPDSMSVLGGSEAKAHLWDRAALSKALTVANVNALPAQNVRMRTTRSEANVAGSMQVDLRLGSSMRVSCSDFAGNGPMGFQSISDVAIDAAHNYWGHPTGPLHPGNPGGVGDAIFDAANGSVGDVSFHPFLIAAAGPGDCPAPVAVEVPAASTSALLVLIAILSVLAVMSLGRVRT